MPTFEVEQKIEQSPESVWRRLLSMEEWPEWSPMFQHVAFHDPARRLDGEWTLHGLLGRVPYSGTFRLIEHKPVERLTFSSITVSTPYEFVRHQVTIERRSDAHLKWRVDYGTSGGPGGWIIDRLMIRRSVIEGIESKVSALASPPVEGQSNS